MTSSRNRGGRGGRLVAALFIGASAFASVSADASAAPHCAPRKVSATGGNAGMAFLAKSKARTSWIRKVSAEPRLGPTYAQWLRAFDRRTVCRSVDNRFVCLAAALPCRSARVVIVAPAARAIAQTNPSVRPVKPARPL